MTSAVPVNFRKGLLHCFLRNGTFLCKLLHALARGFCVDGSVAKQPKYSFNQSFSLAFRLALRLAIEVDLMERHDVLLVGAAAEVLFDEFLFLRIGEFRVV